MRAVLRTSKYPPRGQVVVGRRGVAASAAREFKDVIHHHHGAERTRPSARRRRRPFCPSCFSRLSRALQIPICTIPPRLGFFALRPASRRCLIKLMPAN